MKKILKTVSGMIMIGKWAVFGSALAVALSAAAATASSARYHTFGFNHSGAGYYPGYYIGFWGGSGHWARSRQLSRLGPTGGYKFGWVTYRGDPFAGQDFYDGHSCYYTYKHDYCVGRRWRGGFRW